MTARLDIIVGEVKNALCVPISAIRTDNQGSYVEKISRDEKGKPVVEKIYVQLGLYGDEYVEVTAGNLAVDDEISVTYEAAEKKSSQNNSRRMPGGPPM